MKCPDCGAENIEGADDCSACSTPLANAGALAPLRGMERKILEGTVADIAPQKAMSLRPSDTLAAAVDLMRRAKVGCVLAVEDARCTGLLSERDIVLSVPESQTLESTRISQVMQKDPVCLKPSDPVAEAFHQMAVSGHLHLPVRLKDEEFGVVSARDLLRYLCK